MKKLDIFLLKSYIGPFIATFFVSSFVLMMQFLWKYIDDLVGKGLDTSVIIEFMGLAFVSLVPMALPLAILLASIMTFGNLGEKFELTAIKAAGISLQRTMRPLVIVTFFISLGAFFIANDIIPYSNLKFRALVYSIQNQRPEMNIKPGIFNNDIANISIRVSDKNPKTNMMYNFIVYDHSNNKGNMSVTIADSGSMQMTDNGRYLLVTLYNGVAYDEMDQRAVSSKNSRYPFRQDKFDKQTYLINLSGYDFSRTDENLFKNNYQVQDVFQLERSTDSLRNIYDRRVTELSGNLTSRYYLKSATHRERNYADSLRSNRKHRDKFARDPALWDLPDGENQETDTAFLHEDSIINLKIAIMNDSMRNTYYKIPPKELVVKLNLDSLYMSMDADKKSQVNSKLKQFAVEAQSIVNRNEEDFTVRKRNIAKFRNAWHQKFTLSFACMIFFFIGAPLGAIIRKGGFGLPIVVSVIVFLIYYMISTAGMKMARESVWEPWQGMWLSSFIILPLGIFLTYKATVDAQLFNKEAWIRFFGVFGKFFSGLKKFSDTGDNTDPHPLRKFCQSMAYVLGLAGFGLAFSPLRHNAMLLAAIGIVMAGVVIFLNKKFKFKSKFAIAAIVICVTAIVIAVVKPKGKKAKAPQQPAKMEQVMPGK